MQMTTFVSYSQAQIKKQQQEKPQNDHGPQQGVGSNKAHAETRDPPSQDPEITKSSHHGMTFTLTLEANTDKASGEKNYRSETGE